MVLKEFDDRVQDLLSSVMSILDTNGHTPLHISSFFGDFKISRLLAAKGANKLFEGGQDNETPLTVSKDKYSRDIIQTLNDASNTANGKDL